MAITIVGLGPGDSRLLTRQAWELLVEAQTVYLRTRRHPTVAGLPAHLRLESFDHLYESATDFGEVYRQIAEQIVELGRRAAERSETVIYAVPGNPFVGESTVAGILALAKQARLEVDIVAGLSFVEPALTAVEQDALDGLQCHDAIEVAELNHPPLNPDLPVLLGQVYNKFVAGELKLALMAIYPEEHEVMLIHAAGTGQQVVEKVPLYELDHSAGLDHLTSLFIPALPFPSSLPALAETVAYLRGPNGCPWDQEQTAQSLREDILEETAEVLAAIDAGDVDGICEELGDLLYHLLMQAQIASESGDFNMTTVIAGIDAKLKRRHPHVWGDWEVSDSTEAVRNWEKLKQREKVHSERQSILDNVPELLPALAQAQKIQRRVGQVGFDWPDVTGVVDKVDEELAELKAAQTPAERSAELGDLLFAAVNLARWYKIDAESALREANLRFGRRFRKLEALAQERGLVLTSLTIDALDDLWNEVKQA